MTENSSGSSDQHRPDDWTHGRYVPGEQYNFGGGSASGGSDYGSDSVLAQGGSDHGSGSGSGQAGSGYGSGQAGAGYGSSGQGAGQGAVRPAPGTAGSAGSAGSAGTAGPSPATAPIWQVSPGQGRAAGQGDRGQAGFGQSGFGQDATSAAGQTMAAPPLGTPRPAESRGFLGALFDFSFTSFVTTKIIKVLYVLILVLASITALIYTIVAFRLSMGFGLLTLIIGDPLFIIIVMAFWRLVLESFIVLFRMAEDIRALRERSGTGAGRQSPLP